MNREHRSTAASIPGLGSAAPSHLLGEPWLADERLADAPDARRPGRGHARRRRPPNADGAANLDEVLLEQDFLKAVWREQRRVDRSKAPLAIALFQVEDAEGADRGRTLPLEGLLLASKRETDIMGYLDDHLLAILFPDTGEAGARRFVEKLAERSGHLTFSTTVAGYPDRLFDGLAKDRSLPRDAAPRVFATPGEQSSPGYPLKRSLDVLGALLAIALLLPLMLLVALLIATTSPGPVIFKQKRMGKGGRPFTFYKFRSMAQNADDGIHREFVAKLIDGDPGAGGAQPDQPPVFKMKKDPRVTRIGSLIRKTSIDEIPQFFNVLRGDMSLVGPRPPLAYEAERYQSWHLRRILEVTPGITGLWQVEGRSRVTFDEMVRMDLWYTRHASLALDLKILLKTVKVVLRCDGAS